MLQHSIRSRSDVDYSDDLAYMIKILNPEIIVRTIIEYRSGIMKSEHQLLNLTGLSYLNTLINIRSNIKSIVRVLSIHPKKQYQSSRGSFIMQKIEIMDSNFSRTELILWDNQPNELINQRIGVDCIILFEGANTRKDKYEKLSLNIGSRSKLRNISEFIDSTKFFNNVLTKITDSNKLVNIKNTNKHYNSSDVTSISRIELDKYYNLIGTIDVIYPISLVKTKNNQVKLGKVMISDGTGTLDIQFWGESTLNLETLSVGDTVFLTGVFIKENKYKKTVDGIFRKYSKISIENNNRKIKKVIQDPLFDKLDNFSNYVNHQSKQSDLKDTKVIQSNYNNKRNDQSNFRNTKVDLSNHHKNNQSSYNKTRNNKSIHSIKKINKSNLQDTTVNHSSYNNKRNDQSNFRDTKVNLSTHNESNIKSSNEIDKTSIQGKLTNKPFIKNIENKDGFHNIWIFELVDNDKQTYLIKVLPGSFNDSFLSMILIDDRLIFENVTIKPSFIHFDYEVIVKSTSIISIVKN